MYGQFFKIVFLQLCEKVFWEIVLSTAREKTKYPCSKRKTDALLLNFWSLLRSGKSVSCGIFYLKDRVTKSSYANWRQSFGY